MIKLYGVVLRYSQPSITPFRAYFSRSIPNQDNGAKAEPRSLTDQLDPHDLDAHLSRETLGNRQCAQMLGRNRLSFGGRCYYYVHNLTAVHWYIQCAVGYSGAGHYIINSVLRPDWDIWCAGERRHANNAKAWRLGNAAWLRCVDPWRGVSSVLHSFPELELELNSAVV